MPIEKPIKVALITGAAKRIGRAIALDLAKNGWAVAIHCNTSIDDASSLATQITELGGTATVIKADLMDRSRVRGLVDDAKTLLGAPVSLLINNASLFEEDDITSFTQKTWDSHFEVNLHAPMALIQSMATQLPNNTDANVINIIDQRVWKLTPECATYTMSKSALWTLTQTAAQALAPQIRVNAIGPGPTLASKHQTDDTFDHEASNVLLGHGPALGEITNAIDFILNSPSMTGQMIALDGGQHLAWQTPDVILATKGE